jgi:hypothetical protein
MGFAQVPIRQLYGSLCPLMGVQSGFSDFSLRPLRRFHKTGRFLGQSNSKNLDI